MISDLELVTRVTGSDDQAAFQQLVERHQAAIRRFLRRLLCGDQASADDLAQDTFLLAYRKLATWRARSSFSTWLHSIAYRQFLRHLRKHGRQQVMAEPPDPGFDSGDAVDAEIMLPLLLRQVTEDQRACLTLAFAAGMSHAEISAIIGLPVGSVKSHIFRGRQRLQQWLNEHDHSLRAAGPDPATGVQHV
jgi:RNA polymerase sigma-70 factor (ECF subfamily)